MRHFSSLFIVLGVCLLAISCATLRPVTLTQKDSILDYQYIYITPTAAVNSTSGGVYGGSYGVYGATSTKTADPASLISGYFLKKGFTRLPELTPELLDKTLVVNYGEWTTWCFLG